jgi:hypothetical protein
LVRRLGFLEEFMRKRTTHLVGAAVFSLALGVGIDGAAAGIIYSDPLTGSGTPLNGSAVDVGNATGGGVAGATWTASTLLTEGATGATRAAGAGKAHAWLPLNVESGFTYTLQATLHPTGGSWAALGFSVAPTTPSTSNNFQDNSVIAWGLVRQPNAGSPQFFRGGGTFGGSNYGNGSLTGLQTLTIVLDTTALSWTAVATIGSFSSDVKTYATPEAIRWVGFGSDQGPAAFSNFSLTAQPVPEPVAFAPLALAAGGLLRRQRRA